MTKPISLFIIICSTFILGTGCNNSDAPAATSVKTPPNKAPEYFLLRPKLEKEYGYSHAVKIGNDLKISGAVSMNDSGIIVAPGNM